MPPTRPLCPGRRPLCALAAAAALTMCGLAAQAQSDVQTLVSTGQYVTALDKLDAESAQAPRDARLITQRAMLLSLQKRDAQALRLLDGLTARQPDLAPAHHVMALILAGSGDFEGARQAATRAVRVDRGYLPALKTLGELHARQSRQAFEQALKLDSGDVALRSRVHALSALIGPDVVGPGASPFAQPGAIVALAPPAPAPVPPAAPMFAAAAAGELPAPPGRLVALPDGVGGAEVVAATRPGDGARAATFNGLVTGAPTSSGLFGAGPFGVNVDAVASAAAAPAPTASVPAEVNAALRDWAAAWSRRDVAGYLAAYTPGFAGTAPSREAWEQERRERIGARARISVELSEVVIAVNGDRAEARFRQRYASDSVNAVNRKVLQWQRTPGGAWRISRETVED